MAKKVYGDEEYLKMVGRMIKAGAKRVAEADELELAQLIELRKLMDEQIKVAVQGQIANGKSWQDIAEGTGTSRQGAFKKYSK